MKTLTAFERKQAYAREVRAQTLDLQQRKDKCLKALVDWYDSVDRPNTEDMTREQLVAFLQMENIVFQARSVCGLQITDDVKASIEEGLRQNGGEG